MPGASGKPLILFVDDRVEDLLALRNIMSVRGFDLEIARDPQTGYEMAKALKPEIAVLDYAMQPFDGVTLAKKLRKLFPDLYIVFVTGHGDDETRDQCSQVGDGFVTKPYTGEALVTAIKAGYEQRGSPQPSEPVAPNLTSKEWLVLKALKAGGGKTVTRDELIDAVWGDEAREGALEKTISRLRRKIELEPKRPRILFTIREDGYRLDLAALRRTHGDRY